jgi:lysozyme
MNYLIDMIKQHEGLRLKPYHCTADKLTIGYGRNLEDRGITNDEAEYMLRNDIQLCYQELDCFSWFKDLDEPRQYALVDLCFNMGLPVLLKFRKALAAMAEGLYDKAADEFLDSKWAKQVGEARSKKLRKLSVQASSSDKEAGRWTNQY